MMKLKRAIFFVWVCLAIVACGKESTARVIVQGAGAAEAVARAGGTISADLWLIDGVAAELTQSQIAQLDGFMISADSGVKSADWDGYVSNRRRARGGDQLGEEFINPIVPLPDGGAVSVGKHGLMVIFNQDGSTRATHDLATDKVLTAPVISADGTIYLLAERAVYAIDAAGNMLWQTTLNHKVHINLTLHNDHLYTVDKQKNLVVIDRLSGAISSRESLNLKHKIETETTSDADGMYLLDKKGQLYAITWSGNLRWTVETEMDDKAYVPLVVGQTVYVVDNDGHVRGYERDSGAEIFALSLEEIKFDPQVADGLILVEQERRVLHVSATGETERLLTTQEKVQQIAVRDGKLLIIDEKHQLQIVDLNSGAVHQAVQLPNKAQVRPDVDGDGNIVVATEDGQLVLVAPTGEVVVQSLGDKVGMDFGRNGHNDLLIPLGDKGQRIITVAQLANDWSGQPDVSQSADGDYHFYNPTSIDVGADQLHDAGITGEHITIAVVDSGVYFDKYVKETLGSQVEKQFIGQADFVGSGTCQSDKEMTQYANYCWSNHKSSVDAYGHGSHVAGIIWNQFRDRNTDVRMGIAPDADILSVRVLDEQGRGSYSDVIEGIQYVVANKDQFAVRVLNLSLSGEVLTPYFADPLNRAVERAWEAGIVVVTAAGNTDGSAESITAPGNDPYVITVGAVDTNRTAAYWTDDSVPAWSASGPTMDGFVKPDVLAPGSNVVSFIYNDPDHNNTAYLAEIHPDYSESSSFFRMNGTSMATAVTSGVVALMLDENDDWTPDQVKYRLLATARPATDGDALRFPILQQGAGRVWATAAAMADLPDERANAGMDISADLSHVWQNSESTDPADNPALQMHYQGGVQRETAGAFTVYFMERDGVREILGLAENGHWLGQEEAGSIGLIFGDAGTLTGGGWAWSTHHSINDSTFYWAGTYYWSGGWAWSTGWDVADSIDVSATHWVP